MPTDVTPLLALPALRLWAVTTLLLVLKMLGLGFYTSALRLRRRVFATPEDYAVRSMTPVGAVDEDVERVRRAHLNDLENVLPFLVVGLVYALTAPGVTPAAIYFIGFLVMRTLHSLFYVRSMQPHRTIAFTAATLLMVAMVVNALVRLLA